LPPDERATLTAAAKSVGVPFHWIFAAEMCREDQFLRHHLHLTTTEREFMVKSDYDIAWQTHFAELGKTLHYLDISNQTLTTYRNLFLRHRPQVFSGTPITTQLLELEVSTETGEFSHPGEKLKLSEKLHDQAVQQAQAEKRLQFAARFFNRTGNQVPDPSDSNGSELSEPLPSTRRARQPFGREVPCRVCGVVTADWVSYDGQTKTCLCRNCHSENEE